MVTQRQYEYGTSPRKLEEYTHKQASKKKKQNSKVMYMQKAKMIAYVGMFFAIIFTISYRYSVIDRSFKNIQSTKKEYIALQTANDQIELGIKSNLDLTSIERHAKDKLGMQKPIASQIKYVDIAKEDKVVLSKDVTVKTSILDKVWNSIEKLLD